MAQLVNLGLSGKLPLVCVFAEIYIKIGTAVASNKYVYMLCYLFSTGLAVVLKITDVSV